jgi:hypothetical protein
MFHLILIPLPGEFQNLEARHLDVIWIVRKSYSTAWLIARASASWTPSAKEQKRLYRSPARRVYRNWMFRLSSNACWTDGCVRSQRTAHSVLYALSVPRLLQLEAVADEILAASLKAPRVPDYD